MTPERYAKILETIQEAEFRINLAPNVTTMGPNYVAETIAKILQKRQLVNDYCEETELALVQAVNLESDLSEEWEINTNQNLTNLDSNETEGMDAKARFALAQQKTERDYLRSRAEGQEKYGGLRYQLSECGKKVKLLRTLLKILEVRREDLTKLDSGIRLQHQTMKTEVDLVTRGTSLPSQKKSSNGPTNKELPSPTEPTIVTPSKGDEEFVTLMGQEEK